MNYGDYLPLNMALSDKNALIIRLAFIDANVELWQRTQENLSSTCKQATINMGL